MKTFAFFVCFFISIVCLAQPKGDLKNTSTYNNVQFDMAGNNRPNDNVPTFVSGPFQGPMTVNWVDVPISDKKNLFFYKTDSWIYLGHVEYTKKEVWYDNDVHYEDKPFMNGTGLYRYYPEGLSTPEYYYGGFKRGARHGNGFVRMPDGTFYAGKWKWDKLNESSKREATEEEIKEFEHQIHLLDIAISRAGSFYNPQKR